MIGDQEEELRRSAPVELEALPVAELAGRFIAHILRQAPVPPSPQGQERTAASFQHQALWMMAVQTHRALRSALLNITSGYDDQAIGPVRLITELHARARKVYEDDSGDYAHQWLAGRTGGSGARVIGQDFWELLSGPPHSNAHAVLDWAALPVEEDEPTRVILGPQRRPEVSNPTLAFIAGEVRDIGHLLALSSGISDVDMIGDLDMAVGAAHELFLPDDPN